jgi:alkylated DNA repair dioxygenase AlkB
MFKKSQKKRGKGKSPKTPKHAKTKDSKKKAPKTGPAPQTEEVMHMVALTGMTTFQDYGYAMKRATDEMVGQKWKRDTTDSNWLLRSKTGKLIAIWVGSEERVGKQDEAMRIHKDLVKKVQKEITHIQRVRSKDRGYQGECQMWLQGVRNPRWTERQCMEWIKESLGVTTAVMHVNDTKDTNWYRIQLFPPPASLVMIWYVTGKLGWQGEPADGSDLTIGTIADLFDLKWAEIEEGVREGGRDAYQGMRRSQSIAGGTGGEEIVDKDRRGSRTPTRPGQAGVGDSIKVSKTLVKFAWDQLKEWVRVEIKMEVRIYEKFAQQKAEKGMGGHMYEWYIAVEEHMIAFLWAWKEGKLDKWNGGPGKKGIAAGKAMGWSSQDCKEAMDRYTERTKEMMEQIRRMEVGWKGEKGKDKAKSRTQLEGPPAHMQADLEEGEEDQSDSDDPDMPLLSSSSEEDTEDDEEGDEEAKDMDVKSDTSTEEDTGENEKVGEDKGERETEGEERQSKIGKQDKKRKQETPTKKARPEKIWKGVAKLMGHTYLQRDGALPRKGETQKSIHGRSTWEVFTLGTKVAGERGETVGRTTTTGKTMVDEGGELVERFGTETSVGEIRRFEMMGPKTEKMLKEMGDTLENAAFSRYPRGMLFAQYSRQGNDYEFGGVVNQNQGWAKPIADMAEMMSKKLGKNFLDAGVAAYEQVGGPLHADNEPIFRENQTEVVSVSMGQEADFQVVGKTGDRSFTTTLGHGTVLMFDGKAKHKAGPPGGNQGTHTTKLEEWHKVIHTVGGEKVRVNRICVTFREYTSPEERTVAEARTNGVWGRKVDWGMHSVLDRRAAWGWEGALGGMFIQDVSPRGDCAALAVAQAARNVVANEAMVAGLRIQVQERLKTDRDLRTVWESQYRKEWAAEQALIGEDIYEFDGDAMDREWEIEVTTANGFKNGKPIFMTAIHIMAMAQIVGRHILVIGAHLEAWSDIEVPNKMLGLYRAWKISELQEPERRRMLVLAYAHSHFGTVVKVPTVHRAHSIQVGQAGQWEVEMKFEKENKMPKSRFLHMVEDTRGRAWAEMFSGERERLDWNTNKAKATKVKAEQGREPAGQKPAVVRRLLQ